jgi:hypothetical protein
MKYFPQAAEIQAFPENYDSSVPKAAAKACSLVIAMLYRA